MLDYIYFYVTSFEQSCYMIAAFFFPAEYHGLRFRAADLDQLVLSGKPPQCALEVIAR